jgi:EXS family
MLSLPIEFQPARLVGRPVGWSPEEWCLDGENDGASSGTHCAFGAVQPLAAQCDAADPVRRAGTRFVLNTDTRMFHDEDLYYGLIGVNFVLRIAWTYKLSSHLRHQRWFVMSMTLLEISRRFMWAFVRIENELRKVSSKQPSLGPLIPSAVSVVGYVKRKNSQMRLFGDEATEGTELISRSEKQPDSNL